MVFIAWSGNDIIAHKVKSILAEKGYQCIVGGNNENHYSRFTIGDVIKEQMDDCDQAIFIIQNKNTEMVSDNLFFEMGYALSKYGVNKIHAVRKASENLKLPTDVENCFIEPVNGEDEETIANGIVSYFISRQHTTVYTDVMELIGDYHEISRFISKKDKNCSKLELAEYAIFFMQAAYLYYEINVDENFDVAINTINVLIKGIKDKQSELGLAASVCNSYFSLIHKRVFDKDTKILYTEPGFYYDLVEKSKIYIERADKLINGNSIQKDFGLLVKLNVYQYLAYAALLCGENPEVKTDRKADCYDEIIEYVSEAEKCIKEFNEDYARDKKSYLSLLRAYLTRNLFVAYSKSEPTPENIEAANKAMNESYRHRTILLDDYGEWKSDSKLNDYLNMEKHLLMVDMVNYQISNNTQDNKEIAKTLEIIKKYAQSLRAKADRQNSYIQKIVSFYSEVSKSEDLI